VRSADGIASADPRHGWAVVAVLAATETISWGVLYYAFAVFLVPMRSELGISTLAVTGAFSLALAVSGVAGIFVGRWLDSHSPHLAMTIGSVLATLLVVAWSRIHTAVQLYAVFAGIGLAMALVLYEPAFIVITKWFSARRHQALTAITLVAALASFIFSPLSAYLISRLGWRTALLTLAVVLATITVPLHGLGLRSPPPRPKLAPDADPPGHPGDWPTELHGFGLLTACFVLLNLVSSALSVLLVTILVADGQTTAAAAGVAGIIGVSQIPGRVIFALVGRRYAGWRLPAIVFGVGAFAVGLLAVDRSTGTVLGFAVVYGMSNGMATLMRAALVADLYGRHRYGSVSSVAAAFVSAARAVGPFAAAGAALLPEGYLTMLRILAGASVLAALSGAWAVASASGRGGAFGSPASARRRRS
jgi:MFS family permease